jgi:hypothetical protein
VLIMTKCNTVSSRDPWSPRDGANPPGRLWGQ